MSNIELTPELLDRVAQEIAAGASPALDELFALRGAPPPEIIVAPRDEDLKESRLAELRQYWRLLPRSGDIPRADAVDPIDISSSLRIVLLLEVIDGGADFRYLIYGQEVAERFGRNMRGELVSEMPIPPNVTALFLGGYRACVALRCPILTEHTAPPSVSVTKWRRLILPLQDNDGAVSRILVGNLPGVWRKPEET